MIDRMNTFALPSALPATFEAARRHTRRHARSFYFASYMLPKPKRLAAYAVYAFCRYADDVIDRAEHRHLGNEEPIAHLHRTLDALYAWDADGRAAPSAFSETVHRYGIPKQHFIDLIDGVTADLDKNRYATFGELYDYCYHVAGVIGLIMCDIFGYSDPVAQCYAEDLGTAMQLTNILRDVREDAAMGRIYLPQDELARFGLSDETIMAGVCTDDFKAFMQFQVERARMYYRRSTDGIALLTNDGSRRTVVLMKTIYSGILDEIERNDFDVFARRHRVHFGKKLLFYARSHRALHSGSAAKHAVASRATLTTQPVID
jgi:15-cis-phytoene synthase